MNRRCNDSMTATDEFIICSLDAVTCDAWEKHIYANISSAYVAVSHSSEPAESHDNDFATVISLRGELIKMKVSIWSTHCLPTRSTLAFTYEDLIKLTPSVIDFDEVIGIISFCIISKYIQDKGLK